MSMKEYSVPVHEYFYRTGRIVVEAMSPESALEMVSEGIESGEIQTVDVTWNPSEHNDTFFDVQTIVVETVSPESGLEMVSEEIESSETRPLQPAQDAGASGHPSAERLCF